MTHRLYAAAPRRGVIPGTGCEHAADPLLGWCAECGWSWEPDESRLPAGTAVGPDELKAAMLRVPLDSCARCGANACARTGPRVWAEWLYERLDGDLLGAAYYGRSQLLPEEVYSAWEAHEMLARQLEWWLQEAISRWRELADNPRARWLDDIHGYGPSYAPLGEMYPDIVADGHDPTTCPACRAYLGLPEPHHAAMDDTYAGHGRTATAAQADVTAAVAARAMSVWPYVPKGPTDGFWLLRGETARGPYKAREQAELAAKQLGGRVREVRFGCWQPEPADMNGSEPQVPPGAELPEPTPVGCCRCERCWTSRARFEPRPDEDERDRRMSHWYATGKRSAGEYDLDDELCGVPGVYNITSQQHGDMWHWLVLCLPSTAAEHGWELTDAPN